MPWISINPASEPVESVAIVASMLYIDPDEVTKSEMAEFYNDYFDPTACQLVLPHETKSILWYGNSGEGCTGCGNMQ